MIFLTASLLGVVAGMTRSAFSIAVVAVMVIAAFVIATVLSAGPAQYPNLLLAVLGYNFGLICLIAGFSLARRSREA